MVFKKIEKDIKPVMPEVPKAADEFNYDAQQKEILGTAADETTSSTIPTGATDTYEDTPNAFASLQDAVMDQVKLAQQLLEKEKLDNTMSSVPQSAYEQGGNTVVTPSSDPKAFKGPLSPRDKEDMIGRLKAKTATDDDLRRIDESMLLDLPFIKAADYAVSDNYNPCPKDPSTRFRWVNYINFVQGNMMRLMADGFEVASIEDVDTDKTPIHPKMLDGTQIKQYDVVMMKINVLKLMALYRRNIEAAAQKLDNIHTGKMQQAAAQQSFTDLVGAEGQSGVLNHYRQAGGKEPVTFNRT